MIYLTTFFITIVLFYITEVISKKNKNLGIFLVFIASLPLAILAGLRSLRIGTDVLVYIQPIFSLSTLVSSFSQLIQLKPDTEIGYLFLNFFISRFTSNFQLYLFILEYIIVLLFAFGLFKLRNNGSLTIGMLLFCFLLFNRSLNIARQFLAMSFVFFNLKHYFEKNNFKFIMSVIFASLFHSSSLLVLPIIYLAKVKNKILQYILYLILFLSVVYYSQILQVLVVNLGILPTKYLYFINNRVDIGINYPEEMIRAIFFLFLFGYGYFNTKFFVDSKHEMNMFMIFDFILLQLGTISLNANRIAWYFFTVYLILISRFFGQKTQSYRMISYLILYIILLLYWWWSFVYSNYGQTYPFEFFK